MSDFYLKKVKLIDPKTFLDDMNETNCLGHEKQYVDIVMFEYFGQHINTWYSVSTFTYFTYLYQYQLTICIELIAVNLSQLENETFMRFQRYSLSISKKTCIQVLRLNHTTYSVNNTSKLWIIRIKAGRYINTIY